MTSEDLCRHSMTSSTAMFYIITLIPMVSGTMSAPSAPLTRFPLGRALCEKLCVNIKGCDVVSYLPVNLMCVIGDMHQEGYMVFHIKKINTDHGLCVTDSSFQGQFLISRSGRAICVRTYPSGAKEKKKGRGNLLVAHVDGCALLVNLETMVTKLYPYKLLTGVIELDYMPWTNSLILIPKSFRTHIVPVGKGKISSFVKLKSHKCAVDGEQKSVFLATVSRTIFNVIHGKQVLYHRISHLRQRPHAFDVDPGSKMIFVSQGKTILRISYNGMKETTFITCDHSVYGFSIDETSNVLYALTTSQILVHNLNENTTAYYPAITGPRKSIATVNSKVFIVFRDSIWTIENKSLNHIGKIIQHRSKSFATCIIP